VTIRLQQTKANIYSKRIQARFLHTITGLQWNALLNNYGTRPDRLHRKRTAITGMWLD